MDPLLKHLINSIKCPLCGGQIEGQSKRFYCVLNDSHYTFHIPGEDPPWLITQENMVLSDDKREYEILQELDGTDIYVWKIDADGHRLADKNSLANPFHFDKPIFNFAHLTKDQILNKCRTILLFG